MASAGFIWVWVVFMVSYGTRALASPVPFALPVALLPAGMAARFARPGGRPASVP